MNKTAEKPLISIIMPAYNAGLYIAEAIESVQAQSYPNWELLIVNDGSSDDTEEVIRSFDDSRFRYFAQDNQGVGVARNRALGEMRGEYFCFLDADDMLPALSLESRLELFKRNPDLKFADGTVVLKTEDMQQTLKVKKHTFSGNPFKALLKLDERCFLGLTWMVKREKGKVYRFEEHVTHSEDLLFFLSLASSPGQYEATEEETLYYRQNPVSAMSNLQGLDRGYRFLTQRVKEMEESSFADWLYLSLKTRKIMCLSYLAAKQYSHAFKALIRL